MTPFDSAKNGSFPEIVHPTKWDDIDVNLEYRKVLANLMYEYEQVDKNTFKKPIKAERNATPVKSERESWLWKLYEKTLKVIVDAVLERVWPK